MFLLCSTASLAEFFGPVLELLQALLAHAGPDVDQARFEIFGLYRSDFFRRHVQQRLAQASKRAHCRIFGQSRDVGAGEAWIFFGSLANYHPNDLGILTIRQLHQDLDIFLV